jgi:hypothetical protein
MQMSSATTVVYVLHAAVNAMKEKNAMSNLNPDYLDIMTTLKIVRLVAGYTLRDVERVSNGEFTVAALGSYERNHRPITVKRLLKLCEVYGISIDAVIRHSMYGDQMHVMKGRKDGLRTTA